MRLNRGALTTGTMVELRTTPAELRAIADDLERRHKAAKCGDEVPYRLLEGEGVALKLTLDQERMRDSDSHKYREKTVTEELLGGEYAKPQISLGKGMVTTASLEEIAAMYRADQPPFLDSDGVEIGRVIEAWVKDGRVVGKVETNAIGKARRNWNVTEVSLFGPGK